MLPIENLDVVPVNYLISNIICYVEGAEHGKVLDEFFLSTAGIVTIRLPTYSKFTSLPPCRVCLVSLPCSAGKFQTEIGKSWAAEIVSRRNSRLANTLN